MDGAQLNASGRGAFSVIPDFLSRFLVQLKVDDTVSRDA